MRICFVAPNYYPHIGGVEKHVRELSQALSRDGHEITIFVEKMEESYKSHEYEDNVEIIRFKRSKYRKFRTGYRIFQILKNFPKIFSADIIHYHDFSTFYSWGRPLNLFLKLAGKKIYITFHGWEGDCPPKKSVINKRKKVEKFVHGNMCVGHFIEKWYGTKADVVTYGGVHSNEVIAEKKNYALFIGRLSQDTGIVDFVKAWKQLSLLHPGFELIICGDGILRKELEEYIANNNLTNVFFKGFVLEPANYLREARIVFVTGYLGILEAFSQKASVISVYNNPLKKDYLEMIPDSKNMMWIVGTVEEIISSFNEAIEDDSKKAIIGHQFAVKSSWESVKLEYYRLWFNT